MGSDSEKDLERRWDLIRQALGAQARGEEPRPVVSQRALFGIQSSVEAQMSEFAAQAARERAQRRAGDGEDDEALRERLLLAASQLGEDAVVGRGMRYFIEAGRAAGFDIPAYPFDPKGEFRAFLAASGARNLPEWYEGIGIPRERYEQLETHALLVLRKREGADRAYLVKGAEFCEASRFVPVAESPILRMCDRSVLDAFARAFGIAGPGC